MNRGTRFQDLFADVMELRYKGNFVRVRAAGPAGDLKNDGYLGTTKTVFQCYGPDEMDEKGRAKLETDFVGAVKHWRRDMNHWTYVHNHPDGIPGLTLQVCRNLQRDAGDGVDITIWSFPELRRVLFECDEEAIRTLLGPAPNRRDSLGITWDGIRPLLEAIAANLAPDVGVSMPSPRKLDANGLSAAAKGMLRFGMENARVVGRFLESWPDPTLGDRVSITFKARYTELRDQGLESDLILSELQVLCLGDQVRPPGEQAAALAILAYLFEACDIFENPLLAEGEDGVTIQ
jgi:hypothetical protein